MKEPATLIRRRISPLPLESHLPAPSVSALYHSLLMQEMTARSAEIESRKSDLA
jgi:hypothetical protein